MTPEAVARKFANSRPNYDLVSYGEVGLPFYRVTLRTDVLEHKPITPFAEFTLRAAAAGITHPEAIEEFLGLEQSIVDVTLSGLIGTDDLATQRDSDGDVAVAITKRGEKTLTDATAIVAEQVDIEIDYDGLLRKPVSFIDDWYAPKDLKGRGVREIPPSPIRPPGIEDIDVSDVENVIRVLGDRRQAKRDLLAFKSIERRTRFQLAVALVFRGADESDVQIAFAIAGALSAAHEAAFARSRLKQKLLGGDSLTPASALAAQVLGKAVASAAKRPTPAQEGDVPDGDTTVNDPVRLIPTYDHPTYLEEALTTATDRLLIISPWVRQSIVNHRFVERLDALLAQGVDVSIGWGITPLTEPDTDIDRAVLDDFVRLSERYRFTFRHRRLGNTHAKVLICDRKFVIITSFNWLSFRGDPKRTFRDEQGTFVALEEKIEEQYERWSKVIAGEKPPRRQAKFG